MENTKTQIILEFESIALEAELFDSSITKRFIDNLPYTIHFEQWGQELYGSIGIDLGEDTPIHEIPRGGIAYTNNGNYLCIFFGQTPAWSVEYIGQITGDDWKKLDGNDHFDSVTIRLTS